MLELPSSGLVARITKAMDSAFPPSEEEGRRGQVAKTHRRMVELFGEEAPERNAVSRWREGKFVAGLDHGYMLAVALGVRPAWLLLDDGPMVSAALPQGTRRKRAHTTEAIHVKHPTGRKAG
jgi:hypothetical protein